MVIVSVFPKTEDHSHKSGAVYFINHTAPIVMIAHHKYLGSLPKIRLFYSSPGLQLTDLIAELFYTWNNTFIYEP